ncbi:hypothetical protein HBB16_16900 [Pseudonocardia sp. MCCB 268]|nr:hypothetical protein [Pseudonocardia cytotoxica]
MRLTSCGSPAAHVTRVLDAFACSAGSPHLAGAVEGDPPLHRSNLGQGREVLNSAAQFVDKADEGQVRTRSAVRPRKAKDAARIPARLRLRHPGTTPPTWRRRAPRGDGGRPRRTRSSRRRSHPPRGPSRALRSPPGPITTGRRASRNEHPRHSAVRPHAGVPGSASTHRNRPWPAACRYGGTTPRLATREYAVDKPQAWSTDRPAVAPQPVQIVAGLKGWTREGPELVQLLTPEGESGSRTKRFDRYADVSLDELEVAVPRPGPGPPGRPRGSSRCGGRDELGIWVPLLGGGRPDSGPGVRCAPPTCASPATASTGCEPRRRPRRAARDLPRHRLPGPGTSPSGSTRTRSSSATRCLNAAGYAMGQRFESRSATRTPGEATICYFGDGATSQGDVTRASCGPLRTTRRWCFFCQNNQWAISVPLNRQTRVPLYQRARGYLPRRPGGRQRRAGWPSPLGARGVPDRKQAGHSRRRSPTGWTPTTSDDATRCNRRRGRAGNGS